MRPGCSTGRSSAGKLGLSPAGDSLEKSAAFTINKDQLGSRSPVGRDGDIGQRTRLQAGPFHHLPHLEVEMTRKYIDCREYPSEMNCTVALSADTDQELLTAAVQHAVAVHKHEDTPELRQQLQKMFKEGTAPVAAPRG
jgi:hypothetical protein